MLNQVVQGLISSKNEAADDVLLEALRLGVEPEKTLALDALLQRKTVRGLGGVIAQYKELPQPLQLSVLQNIRAFHSALRECARGKDREAAIAALRLIARGRQGKLMYVLSEALHAVDEDLSRTAAEAMVALSRWVATETRRLQRVGFDDQTLRAENDNIYRQLMQERPEVEQAVLRALDVHRGRYGQELLRAALLLMDSPLSLLLSVLSTPKHGGQTAMVRRLQQPPDSEHVEAFLLGATHGGLRSHFGIIFSHISEGPVLDALLRRTHWLKDQQLQLCIHQISRGVWWNEGELEKDLARRDDEDVARIGEWIAASGVHDLVQDERLEKLRLHVGSNTAARLRLLRVALRRPRGSSVGFLRGFLADADERFMRMAARDIVRRRPPDFDNMLIQLMTAAPASVRRVISRSVGQIGFESFWDRFDKLDNATRRAAGKAMLKMLPDGVQRIERRLRSGPIEPRMKAMTMVHELELCQNLSPLLIQMCQDANPRLRSKAVAMLAEIDAVPPDVIIERALNDSDARVRANAVEVLEAKRQVQFLPLLAQRARSAHNRERANAIKALHKMRVGTASNQLVAMMQDTRPEHRISALWALRQTGIWQLLTEVGRLARQDENPRVRRYAMGVLRSVAELLEQRKPRAAG